MTPLFPAHTYKTRHTAAARRGHDIKLLTQRIKHTFLLHVLLTLKALCLWLRSCLVFCPFCIRRLHVVASRTTRPVLRAARGVHVTIIMMAGLNACQVIGGQLFQEVQCSFEVWGLSPQPSYPVGSVFRSVLRLSVSSREIVTWKRGAFILCMPVSLLQTAPKLHVLHPVYTRCVSVHRRLAIRRRTAGVHKTSGN